MKTNITLSGKKASEEEYLSEANVFKTLYGAEENKNAIKNVLLSLKK